MNGKRVVTAMLLASSLLGCASSPKPDATPSAQGQTRAQIKSGQNLYANLKQVDGKWVFDGGLYGKPPEVTETSFPVNLNTLGPARDSSAKVTIACITMGCVVDEYNGTTYRGNQKADELLRSSFGPFANGHTNAGTTLYQNTLGALLTIWLYAGVNRTFDFDQEAFDKALDEALASRGWTDEARARVLTEYSELAQMNADLFVKVQDAQKERQVSPGDAAGRFNFVYAVNDKSGLWNSDPESLGVFIKATPSGSYATPQPVGEGELQAFCVSYGQDFEGSKARISEAYDRQWQALTKEWSEPVEHRFSCTVGGEFVVKVQCPDVAKWSGQRQDVKVPVSVESRSVTLYVPDMVVADKTMKATLGLSGVGLENLSEQFVTVEAVSVYWGGGIWTKRVEFELSPRSEISQAVALNDFNWEYLASYQRRDVKNATRSMLNKRQVNVGIAVKYRLGEEGKSRSLYKARDYSELQLAGY